MKYLSATISLVLVVLVTIAILFIIIPLENQLSDCQFECNHQQTKIDRMEELNDLVPALYQLLNPLQIAELKVATMQIRDEKHDSYEGRELPLIW